MGSPEPSAPLGRVRDALVRRVEEASLRQAARDVGMSPSGLRKFLDGAYPYSATRRKLERWYVRESGRAGASPDASLARSAVRVLVEGLPPRERSAAAIRIVSVVGDAYREAGLAPPGWLRSARREWRADEG